MYHVGLDVHWKTTSVCILDQFGRIVKTKRISGHWRQVLAFLRENVPGRFQVVFEASCGYGYLFDALSEVAHRVLVAHPGQLRMIFRSKRKNDRVDAKKLAKLLYLDEVPAAFVPPIRIREWREMIEYRQKTVARVVRCKNTLRALLRTQGIVAPRGLWSRKGLAWLKEVEMTPWRAMRREILLEELTTHLGHLKRVTKFLDKIGANDASVTLLRTIPGVGPRTAEVIAAYVADPHRFRKNRSIGAYLGLVPCQDASAGVNRLGRITRESPATARKLLVEASWQVIRRSASVRARFERLCHGQKDRRKKALVGVARHLACCMLAMLQSGQAWREAG